MCPKCRAGSYLTTNSEGLAMGNTKDYSPSLLATVYHSFPHVDLWFKKVDPTFKPEDARYRESLVFWGAVPILWLVLTLLLFLVYFCYRCCQRDVEKQRPVPCLRWSMAILAIFIVGATGVCFYGNQEAKKGCEGFSTAVQDGHDAVRSIEKQIDKINRTVNIVINEQIVDLSTLISSQKQIRNETKRRMTQTLRKGVGQCQTVQANMKQIVAEATKIDLIQFNETVQSYAFYRWVATLVVLCWKVLLCLILLLGIARTSKYTLLFFSACGIFTLVLCWAMAGLHLSAGVGLGDYCVKPKEFVKRIATKSLKKDTVNYYLKCNTNGHFKNVTKPKISNILGASNSIRALNTSITKASEKAKQKKAPVNKLEPVVSRLRISVDRLSNDVLKLSAKMDCASFYEDYQESVNTLCNQALPGVAFIFLGAGIGGILLSILVLLASKAWRHFGTSTQPAQKDDLWQKGYYEVDQDDPFLPRADNQSPSYYSRGHHTFPREHMTSSSTERRTGTPPPAYNGNGFDQYNSSTLPLSHSTEDHRMERLDRPHMSTEPRGASRQPYSRESQT